MRQARSLAHDTYGQVAPSRPVCRHQTDNLHPSNAAMAGLVSCNHQDFQQFQVREPSSGHSSY